MNEASRALHISDFFSIGNPLSVRGVGHDILPATCQVVRRRPANPCCPGRFVTAATLSCTVERSASPCRAGLYRARGYVCSLGPFRAANGATATPKEESWQLLRSAHT